MMSTIRYAAMISEVPDTRNAPEFREVVNDVTSGHALLDCDSRTPKGFGIRNGFGELH